MKSCETGARYDAINLKLWKACLGGIILLPIRCIVMLPILLFCWGWNFILMTIYGVTLETTQIPRGETYNRLIMLGTHPWIIKTLFRVLAFPVIKEKKVSIYDFIADYEPVQDISKFPFVISNHISPWLDLFWYISKPYSFFARFLVARNFFLGVFGIARQTLFINRASKKHKDLIFKKIEERIPLIMNKQLPPILVYPEGTCSNGYALMRFKKGAFIHKKPIKIHGIKYNADFAPSFNNTHPFVSLFLSTSQFWGEIEAFEVEEPLDPLWVAKKYGIDENDEKLWKYVAKEAKDIIAFMTGIRQSDVGLHELGQFEDAEARDMYDFKLKLCKRKCNVKDFGQSRLQEAMAKKMI